MDASYRFMQMEMDGMRNGTDTLSASEVFSAGPGYIVVPEKMSMHMHMLEPCMLRQMS